MESIFDEELVVQVREAGVIAVLVVDKVRDAVPLAQSLLDGGVTVMELTLRTPVALEALRAIREEVPDMTAGMGTILTPEQVREVADAGAAFGVAPGTNPRVLQAAVDAGLSFAPGVATPSDIEQALEFGCRVLKFFPAESSGGMPYLKSMAAPYAHLNLAFMPLGGLNAGNMLDYLQSPLVAAVGGSWLAKRPVIRMRDWHRITEQAREATEKAQTLPQT